MQLTTLMFGQVAIAMMVIGSPLTRERREEGLNNVGNVSGGSVQVVGGNTRLVGPSGSISTNYGDSSQVVAPVRVPVAVPVVPVNTYYVNATPETIRLVSSGGEGIHRVVSVEGADLVEVAKPEVLISETAYPRLGYPYPGGAGIGVVGDVSGGSVVGVGGSGK